MLYRLYEPLLWRSFKVANPLVRANAMALLCASFPLQASGATRAEADELVYMVFKFGTSLLLMFRLLVCPHRFFWQPHTAPVYYST